MFELVKSFFAEVLWRIIHFEFRPYEVVEPSSYSGPDGPAGAMIQKDGTVIVWEQYHTNNTNLVGRFFTRAGALKVAGSGKRILIEIDSDRRTFLSEIKK